MKHLLAFAAGALVAGVVMVAAWATRDAIGKMAAEQSPKTSAMDLALMDDLERTNVRITELQGVVNGLQVELKELRPAIEAAQWDRIPRRPVGPGATGAAGAVGSPQ